MRESTQASPVRLCVVTRSRECVFLCGLRKVRNLFNKIISASISITVSVSIGSISINSFSISFSFECSEAHKHTNNMISPENISAEPPAKPATD